MWESPIYHFNVAAGRAQDGDYRYRQVIVNVTKSAPPFDEPGKTLSSALRKALAVEGLTKRPLVLDFGAGKLRNTLYLLRQGYRVCAVEYNDLFAGSAQATSALRLAKEKYLKRFTTLVYPHEFLKSRLQFDLVTLINVLNIMPVPAERLVVLEECHKRLKPGGLLFWYTQRGDRAYKRRMVSKYSLGDGYFVGAGTYQKTFYREFTVREIDQMLAAAGFELVRSIHASATNQARVYRRLAFSVVSSVLRPRDIDAANVIDRSISKLGVIRSRVTRSRTKNPPIIRSKTPKRSGKPNPASLSVPALYAKRLKQIAHGNGAAREYQQHVKQILELLFPQELKSLTLEQDVFGGLKRLDILADNKSEKGFFHSLKRDHQIHCPYIVIECKNYRHDLGNREFDQLGSRLGKKLGYAGILAYRSSSRRQAVIRKCSHFFDNEGKVILPLSDSDFASLLDFKIRAEDDKIESHLDTILKEVRTN